MGAYLIPLPLDKALILEEHLFQETLIKKILILDSVAIFYGFLGYILLAIAFLLLFALNLCNKGFIFR